MPKYYHDHVHLLSPDPMKTARFYEEMFGAKRVSVRELDGGGYFIELDLGGSRLLVMNPPAGAAFDAGETNHGLGHFGIRTDNLAATVAKLEANGVRFKEEMRAAGPGVKIAFIWAPENVLIELLEKKG